MILSMLAVTLSAVSFESPSRGSDTLEVNQRIKQEFLQYYRPSPSTTWTQQETRCSAEEAPECFGGDPDWLPCDPDVRCTNGSRMAELIEDLKATLTEHPHAGWVRGYAVYTLTKFDRHLEALEVAQGCQGPHWYCPLLEGMVFHSVGRVDQAENSFRAGLALAPDSLKWLLTEPTWVMGSAARESLQELAEQERAAAADRVWWMADPLLGVEGNDRWSEHVFRSIRIYLCRIPLLRSWGQARIDGNIHYLPSQTSQWVYEDAQIPRGRWDSWQSNGPRTGATPLRAWTSRVAAKYHFVPDFEDGDLSRPIWRLEANLEDEGYSPLNGEFYDLSVQLARFRRSDSLVVVAAGTVADSPLEGSEQATGYFVMTDGPGRYPIILSSELHSGKAVFLARVPQNRFVGSFEVVSENGFGRNRFMVEPLGETGPALSDILLYSPVDFHEPDSLKVAAGQMLPSGRFSSGEPVGVFWEVYGAPAGVEVNTELEVQREGGGLLGSVSRIIPGVGEEGGGELRWVEPSTGQVFPNAVELNLNSLREGTLLILLRAWWEGQEPIQTQCRIEVR